MTARRSGGLFVDEQRRTSSGSPVKSTAIARQPPTPRKAPFQQSSSEEDLSSEAQDSDDPLLSAIRSRRKAQQEADRREERNDLNTSTLRRARSTSSETASSTAAGPEKGSKRVKVSAVTTKTTFSTASGQDRTVVTTTTTQDSTDNAAFSMGGRAIRTAPPKQTDRTINFVDDPTQRRKQWSNTKHFNTVHFRDLAEKRSRTEATPDFGELDFVNGPPPSLPKAKPRSNNDPYARRDMTNRRVQEEDPDDRPRFGQDAGLLADFEKDKIPMMCNAWKLSSTCVYGAQQCRFMHRTHDPEGRPYQLGDMNNRVPQKYRKPPITCEYWYDGNRCKKSAEECLYAHEDTGWTEVNGRPIERKHVPSNSAGPTLRDALPHLVPFKLQNPPITCHYWLRNPQGCAKTEADCKFAHWNTGWAPRESDLKGTVEIDTDLRPRRVAPKYANPPVTCPYWLNGETGCTRPDEECKHAHFNTGWAPRGLTSGQPMPIDSSIAPRSQSRPKNDGTQLTEKLSIPSGSRSPEKAPIPLGPRHQDTKGLTCPVWLRHPYGCPKSEDACEYSHKNTGWATPRDRPLNQPYLWIQIRYLASIVRTWETDSSRSTGFRQLRAHPG